MWYHYLSKALFRARSSIIAVNSSRTADTGTPGGFVYAFDSNAVMLSNWYAKVMALDSVFGVGNQGLESARALRRGFCEKQASTF